MFSKCRIHRAGSFTPVLGAFKSRESLKPCMNVELNHPGRSRSRSSRDDCTSKGATSETVILTAWVACLVVQEFTKSSKWSKALTNSLRPSDFEAESHPLLPMQNEKNEQLTLMKKELEADNVACLKKQEVSQTRYIRGAILDALHQGPHLDCSVWA